MTDIEVLNLIADKLDVIIGFLIVIITYGLFKVVYRVLNMLFGFSN